MPLVGAAWLAINELAMFRYRVEDNSASIFPRRGRNAFILFDSVTARSEILQRTSAKLNTMTMLPPAPFRPRASVIEMDRAVRWGSKVSSNPLSFKSHRITEVSPFNRLL